MSLLKINLRRLKLSMEKVICLFDVDGTITAPRRVIDDEMLQILTKLQTKVKVGLVGGSDYVKIMEQIGGTENINKFEYVFSENGVVFHKYGKLFSKTSIAETLGEKKLQEFLNYSLKYLSSIELPCKRGTFIEFRTGMINISPIGRNCNQQQRDEFEEYDRKYEVRKKMITNLKEKFSDINMNFAIGGQISFDAFPEGWNKSYCLRHLKENFTIIHFYGDKVFKGGNDHEIINHPSINGHMVTCPEDTKALLKQQFIL